MDINNVPFSNHRFRRRIAIFTALVTVVAASVNIKLLSPYTISLFDDGNATTSASSLPLPLEKSSPYTTIYPITAWAIVEQAYNRTWGALQIDKLCGSTPLRHCA